MGRHVARHVAALLEGLLLLSVCCSKLCLMAGSGRGCIDSVQVDCMAASNKGRCQLWGTAKVQVDVAGKHILPGVALRDCLCPWHLYDNAVVTRRALVPLSSFRWSSQNPQRKIWIRSNVVAYLVAGCILEVLSNINKQYPGRECAAQGRHTLGSSRLYLTHCQLTT